jgi:hypothetical protein
MITDSFTVRLKDKDVEFIIRSPSLSDQREAQKIYNQAFSDAVKSGCIVRGRLNDLLKEQGLWDDQKEQRMNTIQQKLIDKEKDLAKGGISLKAAKQIALDMKDLREDLRDLISVRTNLDNHTAEGQADNARFNYLVSACLVYKDSKKPYFTGYEDYLNRASELVAIRGAQILANMLYGLENDYEKKLPENKFLVKYKLVDDKLRLVNKDGKLVDAEGRLIDETGRYINAEGKFVDINGNLVDDTGEYIVDFKPFLDDDGKPIVLDEDKKNDTNTQTQSEEKVDVIPSKEVETKDSTDQ